MNRLIRLFLSVACLATTSVALRAQTTSVEFHQTEISFNYQSTGGVPISTTVNTNIGSNGRMTNWNESTSSPFPGGLFPTNSQFRGLISFGGGFGLTRTAWQTASNSPLLKGTNVFSRDVALAMGLPVGYNNNQPNSGVAIIQRRGQIGVPYLSRSVSFLFGQVIPVPDTDENGKLLTNVVSSSYWMPEPFSSTGHTNASYYWSPNARKVYATQPGPITIRWMKAAYTNSQPADFRTLSTNIVGGVTNYTYNYATNSGNYFRLYDVPYVVSGSPVKQPRHIYWTEKGFRTLGKPVAIPTARIGGVRIAYNNDFPKTVSATNVYVGPGDTSPADGSTNAVLLEQRTLWYDQTQGGIYAYNKEGRVFVELLGDPKENDLSARHQLGIEIVDVEQTQTPIDTQTELGEIILPPAPGTLDTLTPEPILQGGAQTFAYRQVLPGSGQLNLYATRETSNQNDYLVHWMEEGEVGLKWPKLLGRYQMVWPSDVGRYSHYVRPLVATDAEARATAVQLPSGNAPIIEYQDPLDFARGKLTGTFGYYSFLDAAHPAHRALLRFSTDQDVAFERVFSWLDTSLKSTNFVGSVATNLTTISNFISNPTQNPFPNGFVAPRVVNLPVNVGERLSPPNGEPGESGDYLAGHIHLRGGTLYNTNAYLDPLTKGFAVANQGGIIPVNAVPGANTLEVWWFRPNAPSAGTNAANPTKGFLPVYWPSVIGRYTIQWPTAPREIVLASKLGSGTLDTFEANGTIYSQKNRALPGYNPNEEHAIMSGGIAYATRDDLNITNGVEYSSMPHVLVQYIDQGGRPAMSVFKVLREKPSAGWVFDYITEAGRPLDRPMPLPLLSAPVEGSGDSALNYNTEPTSDGGDLPGGWNSNESPSGIYGHYSKFTYQDRKNTHWVYRGLHSGLPSFRVGRYVITNQTFVPITGATGVVNTPFSLTVHASRQDEFLSVSSTNAPGWLSFNGLTLTGTPSSNDVGTTSIQIVVRDRYDQSSVTNTFPLQVQSTGTANSQGALVISCTNSYTGTITAFSNRPPFLATSPASSNSFTMRYYYRTEPSFDWPGIATPPPAGSIVPYLRPLTNGVFVGDATSKNTRSLEIVYRPVWPVRDPADSSKPLATIPYGLTLTKPGAGGLPLPGIRDWKTARVLYQQSIASNIITAKPSVVLHDPTREKIAAITNFGMQALPAGVRAQSYQGKVYFPNLPPHLVKRLFFDPARGGKGALVLRGEFKDETVGEDYLLLNVLRGSDLEEAFALCPSSDAVNYPSWTNAIGGLATAMETFYEDPNTPGSYIVKPSATIINGVGNLAVVAGENVAVDSYALSATGPGSGYITLVEAGGNGAFTQPGDPVALHIFKTEASLHPGQLKVILPENPLSELVTFQHTPDLAGRFDEYEYEWKIGAPVDGLPPVVDATMSRYLSLQPQGTNQNRYTLGGSDIKVLGDNYIVARYRPVNPSHRLYSTAAGDLNATNWSEWTAPQLAEGWIKRVLAGINPFNQRASDLFNNSASTDASIITEAGRRWEGDVALNLDTINNYGLIEIYETVLRRGRTISIESGNNVGSANDALLLAAGYLSDLYMMIGNEAWADAANPTIGIGTANNTYGEIATSLFAFRGQVPSLLEEELSLLRGRDDFLQPGVTFAPFYNRLVWNYTRGIDAGEVIYALNYNIQENPNQTPDGLINAEDAARLFPQGHGDAYGHYLTAMKGYYSLLMNKHFDWVPRIEAVTVLGVPVSVDYKDERKFAAAAAAVGRAGRQVFDLTWRKDYQPGHENGWSHLSADRKNSQRTYTNSVGSVVHPIRYWGVDHWASRVGQGDFINWLVGNSMLPDVDPNPNHEGIQKIDRTTVPELTELATMAADLQAALDNAEGGLTPLGLPQGAVALDINPNVVVGSENGTHFEQTYSRAKSTLQNAVAAFDDAKDVTRLMRSEQDSLAELQSKVASQELAYTNQLIELYGTPYSDDIGVGKTYVQGYQGPDLLHYMYMDDLTFGTNNGLWNPNGIATGEDAFKIDIQTLPEDWGSTLSLNNWGLVQASDPGYSNNVHYIEYNWGPHGFLDKPKTWTGRRHSPGKIQQTLSRVIAAHDKLYEELTANSISDKEDLDKALQLFAANLASLSSIRSTESQMITTGKDIIDGAASYAIRNRDVELVAGYAEAIASAATEALPKSLFFGLATGGDLMSPGRAALYIAATVAKNVLLTGDTIAHRVWQDSDAKLQKDLLDFQKLITDSSRSVETKKAVVDLGAALKKLQGRFIGINAAIRGLADAEAAYQAAVAQGERIQMERMVSRQRTAALIQGYRTRDAAFRIFRNEKLERYKTLFDLSARYAFLAANAYDYETGLLNTTAGRSFVNRIVSARALGVVRNGEPQYAGSNTGDPGLSSALAEMKADWDVVKTRLGFNNPDAYGTTVSLRTENFRILPTTNSDTAWKDLLQQSRQRDITLDEDVRRNCLSISRGNGLPVPGIIIEFSTTIADGYNLFGQQLAAGDHSFSPSSFATKVFGVGAALEGYRGMDAPAANSSSGGVSPSDPNTSYLDPLALAATPYVYLIPVGVDSMRSPPIGGFDAIRTWTVDDVAIPLPFNIGATQFANGGLYLSTDSLSEAPFTVRKHQAFRPVPSASYFSTSLYGNGGTLQRSQYTNNRLIGRSAWNSKWKLVIPGHTMLNDPDEALERFIKTVRDIKLQFVTYSYSGN